MLANFKRPRVRDEKWRRYLATLPCMACGSTDGTVVPAHINVGHEGGMGLKGGDDLAIPLCMRCHDEFDGRSGRHHHHRYWWLVDNLLKPLLRQRYQDWADGR